MCTFVLRADSQPTLLLHLTTLQPTNHLDLEAIDSLADAIKRFNGGMVLVSHDFRLIDQVANEIWLCDDNKVEKWQGDIRSYKDMMKKKMGLIH